ncbi:MAG: hypothetical protein ACKO96_26990 [Flammeovirgaceae bacterium]
MSILFEIKNNPKSFNLNLKKTYFVGQIMTESDLVKTASQNLFKPVSVLQKFDPSDFLSQVWESQDTFEEVESDYQTPAFYSKKHFKKSKTVHLVVPILAKEKDSVFPILHAALVLLDKIGVQKIVLQIITDDQIAILWSDFWQTYLQDLSKIEHKVFLGSLGDQKYAFSKKLDEVCLAGRVMLNPVLSQEGDQYQSIDQYLKLKFEARYYENYDIYTQNQLEFFPKETNILTQIQKALELNASGEIFPLDNTAHSFERNDQIWILDFVPDRLCQLLEILLQLNQVFGLNQSIFSNLDYGIQKESLLEDFQLNSNPEYYPIFDPLAVDSWQKEFLKIPFELKTDRSPEQEFESFLKENIEILLDSSKHKWIQIDYKDFWDFKEIFEGLEVFANQLSGQNILIWDAQNSQIQATIDNFNKYLMQLSRYLEEIQPTQREYLIKELESQIQNSDSKIPLFAGLFLILD